MSRYIKVLNEDGTFTEKKVYLDEDMNSFAEWCDNSLYRYHKQHKVWMAIGMYRKVSSDQLRGLWEDWKAQQRGEESK